MYKLIYQIIFTIHTFTIYFEFTAGFIEFMLDSLLHEFIVCIEFLIPVFLLIAFENTCKL